MKEIKKKTIGNYELVTYQVNDDEDYTLDDVKEIVKAFNNKQNKNKKDEIMIRGLSGEWQTLKYLKKSLITEEDIDEYFDSKVDDSKKFNRFSQLEITVTKYKN
jgi:hypothetical protein